MGNITGILDSDGEIMVRYKYDAGGSCRIDGFSLERGIRLLLNYNKGKFLMNKKMISYKLVCYLSLIPVIGFFIAWPCSWINIYRQTRSKKYIFLHYIIWLLSVCMVGVILYICIVTFMASFTSQQKFICGLVLSYFAGVMMALSSIGISKGIIDKYNLKFCD